MNRDIWYPRVELAVALLAFSLFVGYYGLHCFRSQWIGDIHRHTAAVASLYTDILRPQHEAMPVPGAASEVHTPYIVGVAGAGRLLGITPYRALQWAGVFNLALYVVAVCLFFRTFSVANRSWLPPVAFLAISLLLRDRTFLWASETSVTTLRFIQAYPSFVAWSAALIAFSVVEVHLRRPRALLPVLVALIVWFLVLTHNLTGGWVIGIVACRLLLHLAAPRRASRRYVVSGLTMGLALASGLFLTWLWPYFDITASPALRHYDEGSEFGDQPLSDMARLYLLAFPAALTFLRHRRHALLAGGFAVTFMALQVFRVLDYSYGNRFAFFQAFFAQALLADACAVGVLLLSGQLRRTSLDLTRVGVQKVAFPVIAVAAVMLAFTTPMLRSEAQEGRPLVGLRSLIAAPSFHETYYSSLGGLKRQLAPGDVVLVAPGRLAFDVASITGARVVVSPFAYRVPDYADRAQDVEWFLTVGTPPADRAAILERWRVSKVLVTGPSLALLGELSSHGSVAYSDTSVVLINVTAARNWRPTD